MIGGRNDGNDGGGGSGGDVGSRVIKVEAEARRPGAGAGAGSKVSLLTLDPWHAPRLPNMETKIKRSFSFR